MAILNKTGKVVGNQSQVFKIFTTEAEYDLWYSSLPHPAEDVINYSVIKKYQPAVLSKHSRILINSNDLILSRIVDYFTLTSDTDMTVTPKFIGAGTLEYSIDNGVTWRGIGSSTNTVAAKAIKFRGNMPTNTLYDSIATTNSWLMNGGTNIRASGDITTILKPTGEVDQLDKYAFAAMFCNNTALVSAPKLPTTTLAADCYREMFSGCTALKFAPKLPATILTSACYQQMFAGCAALRIAPKLLAMTLAADCYYSMFSDCKSLTMTPELPATDLTDGCYSYMFLRCLNLIEAPELPVMQVPARAYRGMFSGCTSLTKAPELPATDIDEESYRSMFSGCTALITPPTVLPTQNLELKCYMQMFESCSALTNTPKILARSCGESSLASMFYACTSLTVAPELSATVLDWNCYGNMFQDCTSLTVAPKLSTQTLAEACYLSMFLDCTGLLEMPDLPSTDLAPRCYSTMFKGCTAITTMKELSATTLPIKCYYGMFEGCTNLEYLEPLKATTLTQSCYEYMFNGCTSIAVAPDLPATTLSEYCYNSMFRGCTGLRCPPKICALGQPLVTCDKMFYDIPGLFSSTNTGAYQVAYINNSGMAQPSFSNLGNFAASSTIYGKVEPQHVTFTSDTDMVISPNWFGGGTMEYSIDGNKTWKPCTKLAPIPAAKQVLMRGTMTKNGIYDADIGAGNPGWLMTGGTNVRITGDLTRLLNPYGTATSIIDFGFMRLFYKWKGLVSGPELPSLTVGSSAYSDMFSYSDIEIAPELPAKTLGVRAYIYMFKGCNKLRIAPEILPSTTLAANCYYYMFAGCTSLTKAPKLPAKTNLPDSCYTGMFSESGLKSPPELPAISFGDAYVYNQMFSKCHDLETAPQLPAMVCTRGCYWYMFYDCTSLVVAPQLPATTLANSAYQGMFLNCTALKTPPEVLPSTESTFAGYDLMFSGCTSLEYIPILRAVLRDGNGQMFNGIPDLFRSTSGGKYQRAAVNAHSAALPAFSNLGDLPAGSVIYGKASP